MFRIKGRTAVLGVAIQHQQRNYNFIAFSLDFLSLRRLMKRGDFIKTSLWQFLYNKSFFLLHNFPNKTTFLLLLRVLFFKSSNKKNRASSLKISYWGCSPLHSHNWILLDFKMLTFFPRKSSTWQQLKVFDCLNYPQWCICFRLTKTHLDSVTIESIWLARFITVKFQVEEFLRKIFEHF